MPTNLYGPGDNFDLKTSHVLPALISKFHEAKASGAPSVEVWGSGKPRREFLYVDDCANACVHLMCLDKNDDIIIKTWYRSSVITPEMVGFTFGVHNGHEHIKVKISDDMVGHKLGEFSPTKVWRGHGGRRAREEEAAGTAATPTE